MRVAIKFPYKKSHCRLAASWISASLAVFPLFVLFSLLGLSFSLFQGRFALAESALDLPPADDTIIIDENYETNDFAQFPTATEETQTLPPVGKVPVKNTANSSLNLPAAVPVTATGSVTGSANKESNANAAVLSGQKSPEATMLPNTLVENKSQNAEPSSNYLNNQKTSTVEISLEVESDKTTPAEQDSDSTPEKAKPQSGTELDPLPADPLPVDPLPVDPLPVDPLPADSLSADSSNRSGQVSSEYSIAPSEPALKTAGNLAPQALFRELEPLLRDVRTQSWANSVQQRLKELSNSLENDETVSSTVLNELYELFNSGLTLGKSFQGDPLSLSVFRVCYGIKRRYSVWNLYAQNETLSLQPSESTFSLGPQVTPPPATLPEGLISASKTVQASVPLKLSSTPQIDKSEAKTATDSYARQLYQSLDSTVEGKSWIRFFHLGDFPNVAAETETRKLLLIQVLSNLNSPLTVHQASFLADGAIVRFTEAMQRELRQFPLPGNLLESLELFEFSPEPCQSEQLGMVLLQHKLSGGVAAQAVPYLENSYRNANIRFDVSQKLLNRLAPAASQMSKPVNDIILNRHVYGSSITHTRPRLRLIPDAKHFQAVIDLEGTVNSSTVTNESGITFQQRSDAFFRAQLPLILSVQGIAPSDPIIRVNNQTRLQSIRTGVDIIPIVGSLVQEAARSQHQQYSSMASSEVEQKIAANVRQELSAQANERINRINQNWENKAGKTLRQLGIEMSPIDAQTNTENAVLRFRVAGHDQLGASTPRPQATDGALLNLQIHDSICNNVIQRLNVNGKTFQPAQLREYLASKLNLPLGNPDFAAAEGENRLWLTFAKQNPIWVRFDNDCMILQLSFDEIVLDDRTFENVKAIAKYSEKSVGLNVSLERKDVVQIAGCGGIGKQITLRTIFSKVFSLQKEIHLIPQAILEDARWKGVTLTQFDLTDGWLAITLGE